MSSEARQRKLNQQRQKIKDNQNKKHIQQLKSIQINDNETILNLNFATNKEETSPLVKNNSADNQISSKFAYDGPQSFELTNTDCSHDGEIEIYHLDEQTITEKSLIIEKSKSAKKESRSKNSNKEMRNKTGFNYSKQNIGESNNISDTQTDENDITDVNEILSTEVNQNESNIARDGTNIVELSENDLDSSANISNVAVSPLNAISKHSDICSSGDVDSIPHDNVEEENFHNFPEHILDSNLEIESFVTKPAPEDCVVKCRITRDKRGMDKGMYPTYYLHLERKNAKPLFLLAARRRKYCKTSNYLISYDATDMKKNGFGYLAKLRANFIGTQFSLYDSGQKPQPIISSNKPLRAELAAIIFETNVLGFKGPRKMTMIIPGMTPTKTPIDFQPKFGEDDLLERCRTRKLDNLLELHNKKPVWNEGEKDSQSYVLNFHGRVTQASVKNFQVVHDNDAEYIIMQFGRTSDHSFSMDFAYPLSAVQAFGIALSSFDGKLACE